MSQLSLFGGAPTVPQAPAVPIARPPTRHAPEAHAPRWYQEECLAAIERSHQQYDSTLALLATGLGKSVIASTLARRVHDRGGSVLVMAHRNELVSQMAKHLERATGEYVEVEQAELRASYRGRLVVASTQSLSPARLERLGKGRFALVICDEAHNYLAPSFRRAFEFFDAKRLGITATADRTDEAALGQIFDDVAYCFDIAEGIDAGYLVPIVGQSVHLAQVDLSEVRADAKDLVQAQLDDVMLAAGDGFTHKLLELAGDRKGPLFLPGVKSAEYVATRLNALRPGSAGFVSGEDSWAPGITAQTHPDKDERRKAVIAAARAGRVQWLANCAVLTEGFDWPEANVVGMGRPTKSRQLYTQCCGRGTRVLGGVVDHVLGKEGGAARRAAIAASAKPNMLLLDFEGNAGRHSLIGPADVLGGNYEAAVVDEAKKAARGGAAGDIRALLENAKRTLRLAAERERSRVQAQVTAFDPFGALGVEQDSQYTRRFGRKPISEKQFALLTREGMSQQDAQRLSRREASQAIDEMFRRQRERLASFAQLRAMARHGIVDRNITKDQAIRILGAIDARRGKVDMEQVRRILSGQ